MQDEFWGMHDRLLRHRGTLTTAHINAYARQLKLDMNRFENAMADVRLDSLINRDLAQGKKLGVTKAPAVFLNEDRIEGEITAEHLQHVLETSNCCGETWPPEN